MLFLFKDVLPIEVKVFVQGMEICSAVFQSHFKQGTQNQSVKILTLNHYFLMDY